MRRLCFLLLAGILLLTGCGITVVPEPASTDARVDPVDRSITEVSDDLRLTVRVQNLNVGAYPAVENLTSFYVAVVNLSESATTIPLDSFVLFDDQGTQYNAVAPGAIQSMLQRESSYLIPYPYVGYYYLQDAEIAGSINSLESALPFFAENHPQDLFIDAFPVTSIYPGARVAGMVYFPVDLALFNKVEFRVYLPGSAPSASPDFRFPFSIEK